MMRRWVALEAKEAAADGRGLGLDIVGSVSEKIVDGVDTITDSFVGFTSGMDDFGHKMSNIAKYPSKFGKDCMSPNTK